MELKIRITLDNASFRTDDDELNVFEVSELVRYVANRISVYDPNGMGHDGLMPNHSRIIKDWNGNTVGTWSIKDDAD